LFRREDSVRASCRRTEKPPAKPPLNRHDGAVENAVRSRNRVARDDRIPAVAPDHVTGTGGPLFQGMVGKARAEDGMGRASIHDLLECKLKQMRVRSSAAEDGRYSFCIRKLDAVEQELHRHASHAGFVHAHRGQSWGDMLGQINVVKPITESSSGHPSA